MQVTILGITGGIGRAVADVFLERGIPVVALVRDPSKVPAQAGLTLVEGDATDPAALRRAIEGSEVVLHGLNLPYDQWDPGMIELTRRVLDAVEQTDATLLFPGNLYGLGPDFSAPLTETSSHQPISRKGALRNQLEAMLEGSPSQTLILRMGDFFGGGKESTWMHHLTQKTRTGGAIQYPGALDIPHAWAYLPDAAEVFVELALRREELGKHSVFHFAGHTIDGQTWVESVRSGLGDLGRRQVSFPWFWMRFASPFVPFIRELFETRYLWDQPVRMDDSRLRAFLGKLPHTPLDVAVKHSLSL